MDEQTLAFIKPLKREDADHLVKLAHQQKSDLTPFAKTEAWKQWEYICELMYQANAEGHKLSIDNLRFGLVKWMWDDRAGKKAGLRV